MTEDREALTFTEAEEHSWREYLRDFAKYVYPVFEPHGFTLPQAFDAWQTNRLRNAVGNLVDHIGGHDE